MGTVRTPLHRVVVIKTWRKNGNGAKGGGRKGNSGKRGRIYQVNTDNTRTELAFEEGSSFTELSHKLRARKIDNKLLIPEYVSLNKSGETHF